MLAIEVYRYLQHLLRERPPLFSDTAPRIDTAPRSFTEGGRSIHVLTGAADCRAALTHPDMRQHEFATHVRKMLPGGGTDSRIAADFLEPNPISLNGGAHRAARQAFIRVFNDLRRACQPALRAEAGRALAPLQARPGRATVTGCVSDYVDGVVACLLSGLRNDPPQPPDWAGSSACVFEFFPSAARLRKKEEQVRGVLSRTGAAPAAEDPETGVMLSLLLQGRDPLAGGLCAFLSDLAASAPPDRARKLAQAEPKALFQRTAPVNYIGRVAARDLRIGALPIAEGDEIIVVLPWASGTPGAGSLAFGAGAHVCAGQALALDIAAAWLDELRRTQDRINWADLRPVETAPSVFQQFEETTV